VEIDLPYTKEELTATLYDLVAKVDSPDQMLYWQVTRGTAMRNHIVPGAGVPSNLWVTIKPLTGLARMEYWALNHQDEADERTRKRIMLALVNGADFSETEVWQLVTLDWEAALDLSGRIHAFTDEFERELDKFKAEAEKNSKMAHGTITPA
jgi:hypothetical protein